MFEQFKRCRALPCDDLIVIEGVNKKKAMLFDQRRHRRFARHHIRRTEHDVGPVRSNGALLRRGRVVGHHHSGLDAAQPRCPRQRRAVIARGMCYHPAPGLLIGQR